MISLLDQIDKQKLMKKAGKAIAKTAIKSAAEKNVERTAVTFVLKAADLFVSML